MNNEARDAAIEQLLHDYDGESNALLHWAIWNASRQATVEEFVRKVANHIYSGQDAVRVLKAVTAEMLEGTPQTDQERTNERIITADSRICTLRY
jgi:hypothetical protein